MKFSLSLVILLLAISTIQAQDSIKLNDGSKRVTGEIIDENESTLTVVTRMGELTIIKKSQVVKIRRGKGLSKKVAEKLAGVDETNAEEVFEVASWAAKQRSLKSDAKRLARRVLAIDGEHGDARQLLGHAKAEGKWYKDAKTAERVVAKSLKEEGRKKFKGGWALEDDLKEIKAEPKAWMIEDHRWRLVFDVMKEKGYLPWNGGWVPPEEKALIEVAESIKNLSEITTQFAQVGPCQVWHFAGRAQAHSIAKMIDKTRKWAAKAFGDSSLSKMPDCKHVVVETAAQFEKFLYNSMDVHGYTKKDADERKIIFGELAVYLGIYPIGGMLRMDEGREPRHLTVWDLGANLSKLAWGGRGNRLPVWIPRISSIHAEIAVLGKSTITQFEKGEYDREVSHKLEGGTHAAAHAIVLAQLNAGKKVTIRDFFSKPAATMTSTDDTWATVFLSYLLSARKQEFEAYMRDPEKGMNLNERFIKHFAGPFEDMQPKFEAWIRANG